jgi:hypothetical protein
VVAQERRPTLEIAYREEKRVFIETVMKPREVEREVACATVQTVTEVDPHTGCAVVLSKPCTEIKRVKETVYEPATEERVVIVRTPYLRRVDVVVPRKTLILEYRTDMQRQEYPVRVPCADWVNRDRVLQAPKPLVPPVLAAPSEPKSRSGATPPDGPRERPEG